MNLATVRTTLEGLLSAVDGLTVYPKVPGRPVLPAAVVDPAQFAPHAALDAGSADGKFTVQLLVQWADIDSAQDVLDGYTSSGTVSSVVGALEQDPTVAVEQVGGYGTITLDDGEARVGSVVLQVLVIA